MTSSERILWQSIQNKVGVRPDGDPGPVTARAIMKSLGIAEPLVVPSSPEWPRDIRSEMDAFYGPPGDGHTVIDVPYTLYMDGRGMERITVHRRIAQQVQRVLSKALAHYGAEGIHRLKLDVFDGCFNNRPKRGGSSLSVHAYAAALDFCAEDNELHADHRTARFAKPEYDAWWRFWEAEGAVSLGRARDYDWMHVQFARLP